MNELLQRTYNRGVSLASHGTLLQLRYSRLLALPSDLDESMKVAIITGISSNCIEYELFITSNYTLWRMEAPNKGMLPR